MPIATGVLGIVLVSALPAAQTAPGVQPPAPRPQTQVAPPAQPERPRVVCGMTLITPDGRTAFPIREFTPPPNAPRFTMRTIPGECERPVMAGPVPMTAFPPRRQQDRPLFAPPPEQTTPRAPSPAPKR